MPYFANTEGYKLYYEEFNPHSKRCTVILLHGFASSVSFFKEQIKVLKEYYRVLAFDAIGHGRSDHPENINISNNIRNDILRDLEDLLNHLNIEGPYGIIGHSLVGGMIAQLVCKKHPEDVKFLILLNSGYINTDNVIRNIFYNLLPYMIRMNFLDALENSIGKIVDKTIPFIVQALSNSLYNLDMTKEELYMHIEDQIFRMINEIKNYEPDWIKCPTLIIGGRLDNFAPEQMSEALHAKIPHSQLEIIDMAGHFGPAQRNDVYNEIICDFVRKLK
ncbi:MAG: alpha/beta fold hydrolase [Candidatus Lokiarchaeota archaeon]|nr:alpha/beta fold hydrolase [Candidatus Lokiarchaeota archaeon]MBD3201480.1 alpha/beta fold hydrolase [Candidatus Lokiarchaeota archaeon]